MNENFITDNLKSYGSQAGLNIKKYQSYNMLKFSLLKISPAKRSL